jgi:AAA domain
MTVQSAATMPMAAESLNGFKPYTMAHPKLKALHDQVLRAIREPGGHSLLFILGPTGVGKTTLISRLRRQLTSDLQPLLEQDRESMAVAGIEAEAPTYGNYDFKQHFKQSLKALGEILIDHKTGINREILDSHDQRRIIRANSETAALRGSLEDALKRRRPVAFFIDEAHHLGKVAGGRKFQDHLDVIKSLANMTAITHILVGTYELQLLLNLSDQLSRRSRTFHFERYRPGRQDDLETFQNIIWSFQQRLPLETQEDLRIHTEYLMERSLGCVGILKCWLVRAADTVFNEGESTLTLDHLHQHQPSDAEWRSIATALLEGEEALRQPALDIESLRLRLREGSLSIDTDRQTTTSPGIESSVVGRNSSRLHPGERRPRRDPVGKIAHAKKTA